MYQQNGVALKNIKLEYIIKFNLILIKINQLIDSRSGLNYLNKAKI